LSISEQILGKIRKTSPLTKKLVKSVFVNTRKNSNYFIGKLNSILSKIDYSQYPNFKWDINPDILENRHSTKNKYGVWVLINGEWRWSWINTIETNYSALFILVEFFNENVGPPINLENLNNNFTKECNRLLLFIFNNSEMVFGFGGTTDLSKKLQVATGFSWYGSKFSEMTFIRMYNQYNLEVFIPKNRGNGDDYTFGIDFKIGDHTYQHKIDKVELINDSCLLHSSNIHKSKHEKVDRFVYEYGNSIYLFDTTNISDPNIIELPNMLVIPNDRLIDIYDKPNDLLVSMCESIFKICMSNNYIFEMYDSNVPYVMLNEKEKSVIIGFTGVDLESISKDLTKVLDYLMVLTNSDAKLSEYSPSPIT
jgi:hypothetical protein